MLKKIFIIIFILNIFIGKSYSSEKIYFLDIDYIINNSNFSKKIFDKINNEFESKKKIFLEEEKVLINEDKNLSLSKNIISEDEFQVQTNLLSKKIKNHNTKKEAFLNEINLIRNEKIVSIINSINPIIEKYIDENQIDIVLNKNSIFISKNEFDITDKILMIVNNNLK